MHRHLQPLAEACGLSRKTYYLDHELNLMRLVKLRNEGKEAVLKHRDKGLIVEIKIRTCLCCGREFASKGIGNRQCEDCLTGHKDKGLNDFQEFSVYA